MKMAKNSIANNLKTIRENIFFGKSYRNFLHKGVQTFKFATEVFPYKNNYCKLAEFNEISCKMFHNFYIKLKCYIHSS